MSCKKTIVAEQRRKRNSGKSAAHLPHEFATRISAREKLHLQ
jgi:hypothetical protein